jgi:hypothetical protein
VVEEEEYYDEEDESEKSDANSFDKVKNIELERLQALVEGNQEIPEIIILKDEYGVPQEYEVIVESEEFETDYLESQGSRSRRSIKLKLA